MGVLDEINGRRGGGVFRLASVPAAPKWANEQMLHDQDRTALDGQDEVTGNGKSGGSCVP